MEYSTLAREINEFMKGVDPYEYSDTVDDEIEFILEIYDSIRDGDIDTIETYLVDFIEEDGLKEDTDKAKELLKEIRKVRK